MKKFFIAGFISGASIATISLPSAKSANPIEQCVQIMVSNADPDEVPYYLMQKRSPHDYQDVYNLVTQHPKLLKGIIHDGKTFAMLCVQRGYADVLERLINENYPVDLATPCNVWGPHEPETTVLHELLGQVWQIRFFKDAFSEDYSKCITRLTKLIINEYPDLLDLSVNGANTARSKAIYRQLYDLIPRDLP